MPPSPRACPPSPDRTSERQHEHVWSLGIPSTPLKYALDLFSKEKERQRYKNPCLFLSKVHVRQSGREKKEQKKVCCHYHYFQHFRPNTAPSVCPLCSLRWTDHPHLTRRPFPHRRLLQWCSTDKAGLHHLHRLSFPSKHTVRSPCSVFDRAKPPMGHFIPATTTMPTCHRRQPPPVVT